jgi:hypothetical protein
MGTVAVLLPLLISVLEQAPATIEAVKKIWALMSRDAALPTRAEQAKFDDALEAAHTALQNA